MIRGATLILVLLALATSGCLPGAPIARLLLFGPDEPEAEPESEPEPEPELEPEPGEVGFDVILPGDDRPLGPDRAIDVVVTSEVAGVSVVAEFAERATTWISGASGTATFTGRDLGEGFGTLFVSADNDDMLATRRVTGLLVDLTPPVVELEAALVNARGEGDHGVLEAWVGDAWVLGDVVLELDGEPVASETFSGWPETLGAAWDWSLFTVPGFALPVGAHDAALVVTDLAGNVSVETFDLVVDGTAPTVTMSTARDGASVIVEATAVDEREGPLGLSLVVGGLELATAAGPSATFIVDATGFAASAVVAVCATDVVANTGCASPVPLIEE